MCSFEVRVFAIRRRPGRRSFEVRWRVAGRDRSRSFATRGLADSYRAELVRAARKGTGFDLATGEPATWNVAKPAPVSWYQHAVAYAHMKWPHLAPHSRASLADALATVTAALTWPAGRRPPAARVRAALYGHAFNPRRARADPVTAATLAWVERASLPVSRLADPQVTWAALDGLCTRLDGTPAAATTISRKRAVFHGALGYAHDNALTSVNAHLRSLSACIRRTSFYLDERDRALTDRAYLAHFGQACVIAFAQAGFASLLVRCPMTSAAPTFYPVQASEDAPQVCPSEQVPPSNSPLRHQMHCRQYERPNHRSPGWNDRPFVA
jgi:hypothetical protein